MNDRIIELVNQFFTGLGIAYTSLKVEFETTDVNIRIETPDSALLIGMHGKSLESFSHLLGRMIENISKSRVHIHLEVNNYMKSKDERLFRFLDSKVEFVTSTGKSSRIENLTAFERKKAHQYISEKGIAGLSTQSDGEGTARALIVMYNGSVIPKATPSTKSHTSSDHSLSEDGVGI